MPRCYTKSGSIEKFENTLVSYTFDIPNASKIPIDSNGNYTFLDYDNFTKSSTPTSYYYIIKYGEISNTQYYKFEDPVINISVGISVRKGLNGTGTAYYNRTPNTTDPNNIVNIFLSQNNFYVTASWDYLINRILSVGDTATFKISENILKDEQDIYYPNNGAIQNFKISLGSIGLRDPITNLTGTWTYNGITYKYNIYC